MQSDEITRKIVLTKDFRLLNVLKNLDTIQNNWLWYIIIDFDSMSIWIISRPIQKIKYYIWSRYENHIVWINWIKSNNNNRWFDISFLRDNMYIIEIDLSSSFACFDNSNIESILFHNDVYWGWMDITVDYGIINNLLIQCAELLSKKRNPTLTTSQLQEKDEPMEYVSSIDIESIRAMLLNWTHSPSATSTIDWIEC